MSFERKPNGDIEFSWVKGRLNGQNILSEVRDQHDQSSCVMYAASAGVEMAILRKLAMCEPATSTDLRFNVRRLIGEYERRTGCTLAKDSLERTRQRGATWREEELLDLFRDHGAYAKSADWSGERKVKLEAYEIVRFPDFDTLGKAIAQGKPILANLPVGPEFVDLKPDEIYEFNKDLNVTRPVTAVHMVLLVGFGFRNLIFNSESDLTSGRPYLVFMHSGGIDFGDKGFGRVFFRQIYQDRFYILSANPPAFLRVRQDSSSTNPLQARQL